MDNIDIQQDNIKVYVRVRPFLVQEGSEDVKTSVIINDENTTIQTIPNGLSIYSFNSLISKDSVNFNLEFKFDRIGDVNLSQKELFIEVGKNILDNCLAGFNGSIIAYGQTGSGKTYSMQGGTLEQKGLIQYCFDYLFQKLSISCSNEKYQISCTFCEIYNENVFDLLSSTPSSNSNISIREEHGSVYVEGLQEYNLYSAEEAYSIFLKGQISRHTASTSMNSDSSRSHSIFTLYIVSRITSDLLTDIKTSRLTLVDLAGSERQKMSKAEGQRLKEAGNINKSLLALGNVINSLIEKDKHVKYRDSKLTFMLKDCLGGNAKTVIIGHINPHLNCLAETISTLRFCSRAKQIKTRATVNIKYEGNVEEMQEEMRRLRHEVARLKAQSHSVINEYSWLEILPSIEISDSSSLVDRMILSRFIAAMKENEQQKNEILELKKLTEVQRQVIQQERMKIKFKENEIERMKVSGVTDDISMIRLEELTKTNKNLEAMIENNPKLLAFASDNLHLRGRIEELERIIRSSQIALELQVQLPKYEKLLLELRGEIQNSVSSIKSSNSIDHLALKKSKNMIKFLNRCLKDSSRVIETTKKISEVTQYKFKDLQSRYDDEHCRKDYWRFKYLSREMRSGALKAKLDLAYSINDSLLEDINDLSSSLQDFKLKCNKFEDEQLNYKQEIEKILNDSNCKNEEICSLKLSLNESKQEVENLVKEKLESKTKLSELVSEKSSLEAAVNDLKIELDSRNVDLLKKNVSIDEYKERISGLEQINIKLSNDNRNLQIDLDENARKLAYMNERDEYASQLESEVQTLKNLNSKLQALLDSKDSECAQLNSKIQDSEEALKSYLSSIQDAETEKEEVIQSLKSEIMDERFKVEDIHNQYLKLENSYNDQLKENAQLSKVLAATLEELNSNKSTLDSLASSIDMIKMVELENKTLEQKFAMILKRNEDLEEANGNLVKHNNYKQKLQYHLQIKQENNELRQENQKLVLELEKLKKTKPILM